MKEKDLAYFKEILTLQLSLLVAQNETSASEIRAMSQNDKILDPLDAAASDVGKNMMLRFKERNSRLITKIKESIERIENGTYGICENCDSPIFIGRLKARPMTTLCIDCKQKQEAFERHVNV